MSYLRDLFCIFSLILIKINHIILLKHTLVFCTFAGLILENKGMRAVEPKKGQESPVKRHNCRFLPLIFPNLGYLERYIPINSMCFWSF